MSELIYHITSRADWESAQRTAKYAADTLEGQGFIHCSKAAQILRVANDYYQSRSGLVILAIDPDKLTALLRWEPGADLSTEVFPHIYGPVNLEAVNNVFDFTPNPDGTFALPDGLG